MSEWRGLGLLGGSFDPVHKGHVALARQLADAARLSEVRFVIASTPPHRTALVASAPLRLRMLKVAVEGIPGFSVEECELGPDATGYTVDTLEFLSRANPGRTLCWMMGFDSFLTLPSWRRWRSIFDLAHLLVGARAGHQGKLPAALKAEIESRSVRDHRGLRSSAAGRIMICRKPVAAVSSSRVRRAARAGDLAQDLIPARVARIISDSGAYAGGEN
jgi:nicotinate-nucleotide adenylyltransferase